MPPSMVCILCTCLGVHPFVCIIRTPYVVTQFALFFLYLSCLACCLVHQTSRATRMTKATAPDTDPIR